MKTHEQEFLEAFEANANGLFRHALFRVSDRERAYDLTQDTFLKAWDYLVGGGTIQHHKSFLFHVLNNLIVDSYRKKTARSLDEMLENEATAPAVMELMAEGSVEEAELLLDERTAIERIRNRIPELPELYKTVLTMRFIDDFTTSEIAELLNVTENVVSVRIHRGVSKLRALCKQDL